MRLGLCLSALAAMWAAGCLPYEDYTVERRIGVQRPVVVERAPDGSQREVIYIPQGRTNFYIDYYDPYPDYLAPGYATWYAAPSYPVRVRGYPGCYGPYPGYTLTDPRGPGTMTYPYGYAGGVLWPAGGTPFAGGGSRYYPGSGVNYGAGQPRESYGIYGNGNAR